MASESDYGGPIAPRPTSAPLENGTAANRYTALEGIRMPYQFRAIRQASLTLPNLFRIIGANGTTDEITAWQSLGARCVNNLTSKLMLSIFPPGVPFIRIKPSRKTMRDFAKLDPDAAGELKSTVDKALGAAEQEFADGVAEDGDAANLTLAFKNLLVGGNYGLQFHSDGTIRGIPFVHWVVVRDKAGNLLEFCIKDQMVYATLPPDVQAIVRLNNRDMPDPNAPPKGSTNRTQNPGADQQQVDLFTYGRRGSDGEWLCYQEVNGFVVPNTKWHYSDEAMPFMFIPFNLLDGEHYGRSYCEDYEGDLQTLDGLEQTITEGTAAAALFVRMVKPGGVTNKRVLAEAQNGDVITGDANDVATLESNKNTDFEGGIQRIEAKEERIKEAFLLGGAAVRDAERVTAEEIKETALELQSSLGGLYTQLVPTMQTPYAARKMAALQRTGRMTYLPKGTTKVVMVTGAAALGRNTELQNLDALTNPPSQAAQQASAGIIKWSAYFKRRATALGVDQDGLVMSQEELDEAQQQAQNTQVMQNVAPQVAQQAGQMIQNVQQHGHALEQNQQEADLASTQQQPPQQQSQPSVGAQ